MFLPEYITTCIRMLEEAGFRAYAVGGCVRDAILGLQPQDYDLCTEARPDEIRRVFATFRLILAGENHGTVTVLVEGNPVEITAQPQSLTVAAADNAVFTVEATNVYSYQWYYSKTSGNIWAKTSAEGNTTDTLTVPAKGKNGYWYRCDMKGLDGVTYQTEIVTLTVQ